MRLRLGQVLLATNSTLSAVLRVRNLPEPHARSSRHPKQSSNSSLRGHAVPLDSVRWNAQWAFQSQTSAPERARCRSAKPRRQLRARTQSKLKHSASGPGGRAVPIDSARAGSHLMWLPCEPGLARSGNACPNRQALGPITSLHPRHRGKSCALQSSTP